MDVVRLDKTTFYPDKHVEGFHSKIWTERYTEAGDFEFRTADIDRVLSLLPIGSLVSLRDTKEVMIVENNLIEKDDNGVAELIVKGRSFETFLEQRDTDTNPTAHVWWGNNSRAKPDNWHLPGSWEFGADAVKYTTAEGVGYLIWIGNIRQLGGVGGFYGDPAGQIDNLLVSDSSDTQGSENRRRIEMTMGDRYSRILELLRHKNLGIRTIRPDSSNASIMHFDQNELKPGQVSCDLQINCRKMRLDIYKGVARTRQAAKNDTTGTIKPIVFEYDSDLTNTSYLMSLTDYKNVAHVISPLGSQWVWDNSVPEAERLGLNRRVLLVDASDITKTTEGRTWVEMLVEKGEKELKKHNRTHFFNFQVSPNSRYVYKTHYDLGDRVTVQGEYGFVENLRVNEYVRTEDVNGESGYPTLTRPD